MKRQFMFVILTAGLSAILGSPTLNAQDQAEIATVPFAFQANNVSQSAGTYMLTRATTSGVLRLQNQKGHAMFLSTLAANESKVNNPRLTFTCYGEDCTLSSIWMPNGTGYEVPGSVHESRSLAIAPSIRSVRLATR